MTPDPLVPPDLDLKAYPKMPLAFRRLFASDTWILGNPEERCAALALWCESWHQIPASSLPDDDRVLAVLSQSGARWKRLKAHAMRGWVLCADGRWYHPVVAELAVEAGDKMRIASEKGKAGASKRWGRGIAQATGDLWQGHSKEGKGIEEKGKDEAFVLPGWVPKAEWSAFEQMRAKGKHPLTDYARNSIVAELSRISGPAGENAGAILDQSTRNGWRDVFPLRDKSGRAPSKAAGVEVRNNDVASRFGRSE